MYLYNIAYILAEGTHIIYGAVLIYADTIQEAKGYALEYIESTHPNAKTPQLKAFKVDDFVIATAYMKMKARSGVN